MRDSTIIYRSFYEAIKDLPAVNQGEVWTAVFEYALNFNEVELTGISKTIFTLIRPQIAANISRYKAGVAHGPKGAEHGIKGGRPPKETGDRVIEKPGDIPVVNPVETLSEPSNDNPNGNLNPNPNGNLKKKVNPKVKSSSSAKASDGITAKFLAVYNEFLEKKIGTTEQFSKAGRAGLSKTIAYIRSQVENKHTGAAPETIELEMVNAWRWIFSHFEKWDRFYQNQLKLEQINSNLINIFTSIKNGVPKQQHAADKQSVADLRRAAESVRDAAFNPGNT